MKLLKRNKKAQMGLDLVRNLVVAGIAILFLVFILYMVIGFLMPSRIPVRTERNFENLINTIKNLEDGQQTSLSFQIDKDYKIHAFYGTYQEPNGFKLNCDLGKECLCITSPKKVHKCQSFDYKLMTLSNLQPSQPRGGIAQVAHELTGNIRFVILGGDLSVLKLKKHDTFHFTGNNLGKVVLFESESDNTILI